MLLVRHGEMDRAAFAVDGFTAGLTDRGREQVQHTAATLRERDVTAIYSSTIGRAAETAEVIADAFPGIAVRSTNLLWELPNVSATKESAWRHVFERGIRRGERAYRFFVRPPSSSLTCELLITHGNLIRFFACRILAVQPESWSILGTMHCGITEIWIEANGPRLITYNSTYHLPSDLRT